MPPPWFVVCAASPAATASDVTDTISSFFTPRLLPPNIARLHKEVDCRILYRKVRMPGVASAATRRRQADRSDEEELPEESGRVCTRPTAAKSIYCWG